ncbi:hypothetical protein D3C72_2062110 [compost metagenome]
MVFQDLRLDDRIDRAGLFAETAEDALGQVNIVTRGAARAVVTLFRFDRDGHRRANRFAQFAGDATFLAVRVAAQRVQATETRRDRCLLFRELHRDLARKHVLACQRHALDQLA